MDKDSKGQSKVGDSGGGLLPAVGLLVAWLLNVLEICHRISGTDLPRQVYVLPH